MSGKRGKNDAADAAAICEAVSRPNMRFVPVKTVEQQSRLMVHRAREGYVQQCTATNRIRGCSRQFSVVLPLKAEVVRREACNHLEDLPGYANTVIGDLLSEVQHLDERIKQYDRHIPCHGQGLHASAAVDAADRGGRDHRHGHRGDGGQRRTSSTRAGSSPPGSVWCRGIQLGRQESTGKNHEGR